MLSFFFREKNNGVNQQFFKTFFHYKTKYLSKRKLIYRMEQTLKMFWSEVSLDLQRNFSLIYIYLEVELNHREDHSLIPGSLLHSVPHSRKRTLQAAAEGLSALLGRFLLVSGDAHSPGCSSGTQEQRTALGISSEQSNGQDVMGKEVLPRSLACLLLHFSTGKKHWIVLICPDGRQDEDREGWKAWIAS